MFGRAVATLAAPVFLALFFVATTPSEAQVSTGLLWSGYYVLAHLFFWPPVIVTTYLGRRFRISSMSNMAALMGLCSLVMTTALAVVPTLILSSGYAWRTGLRDALSEAVAAAGGFMLYCSLLGLGRPPSLVAP